MLKYRIIPCLDMDNGRVVKGSSFINLRDAGDPVELAARYNGEGADELALLDITASSEGRKTMLEVVRRVASELFIPLTAGGGIRSVDDMRRMLEAGADKVAINTAAVLNPAVVEQCAREFGSQCVVLAIDAKRTENPVEAHFKGEKGKDLAEAPWQIYLNGGRTPTAVDPVKWARICGDAGAGEILLTSMNEDGRRAGYDLALIEATSKATRVPIIASGGAGTPKHLKEARDAGADAALIASITHYGEYGIQELKQYLDDSAVPVRI